MESRRELEMKEIVSDTVREGGDDKKKCAWHLISLIHIPSNAGLFSGSSYSETKSTCKGLIN